MNNFEFSDIRGLFVDADNFEYEIGGESQLLFTNINSSNATFIKASQKDPQKNVICKIYNPTLFTLDANEFSDNKSEKSWYEQLKLLRESIFLKNLNHPTIVKFLGVNLYNDQVKFESDDGTNPTLFLEFLDKRSIQANIKKNKLIMKPIKRQITMIGIIAAVRFLHHNGVAHRNLVPSSIWLDENYYPRVFDFSKSRESATDDNRNATALNSDYFRYQAPEILAAQDYDMLTIDIFALGRLMYLMITSSEPFGHPLDELKKQSNFRVINKIITDGVTPVLDNSISPALKELLLRCWSNNPSDRPSASEIYDFMITEISNGAVLINGIQKKDLPEIQAYIDMLEKFDRENLVKTPIVKTFELDIPYEMPVDINTLVEKLLTFLNDDDEIWNNEDEFFNLIVEMSEKDIIFEKDYLPRVMKYVDESINRDSDNILVKKFIENVFGECTIGYDKKEIKMGTVNKSVKLLNIPSSVKKICHHALSGYNDLIRVYIPDSVESIDEDAFSRCKNLTFVRLPESLEGSSLGKSAFKDCISLNYVSLPSNLKVINKETFKNNKNLTNITLNDGLEKICGNAFSECETLKCIKIPSTVTTIGKNAFKPCKNLETIHFPKVKPYKIKLLKMGCKYP